LSDGVRGKRRYWLLLLAALAGLALGWAAASLAERTPGGAAGDRAPVEVETQTDKNAAPNK
jgi:hypothetical protein